MSLSLLRIGTNPHNAPLPNTSLPQTTVLNTAISLLHSCGEGRVSSRSEEIEVFRHKNRTDNSLLNDISHKLFNKLITCVFELQSAQNDNDDLM